MRRGDASRRLQAGDVVRVWLDRPGSARRRGGPFEFGRLQILFEDDHLLVVNKPAGVLSVPLPHDDPTPSVYSMLDIPMELFTPIFAVSRVCGWTAHVLEQYEHNRLIRPRAEYVGPEYPQPYVPIEKR